MESHSVEHLHIPLFSPEILDGSESEDESTSSDSGNEEEESLSQSGANPPVRENDQAGGANSGSNPVGENDQAGCDHPSGSVEKKPKKGKTFSVLTVILGIYLTLLSQSRLCDHLIERARAALRDRTAN